MIGRLSIVVSLVVLAGQVGCEKECEGRWGVVSITLTGVPFSEGRGADMHGDVTLGGPSFAFSCPAFSTSGITGSCAATPSGDTAMGLMGYGTNIAVVSELVLNAQGQDGTVFANQLVIPLTPATPAREHDAAPYCRREGTVAR